MHSRHNEDSNDNYPPRHNLARRKPTPPEGQIVIWSEFKLSVDYDYAPAEPMTQEYPGCAESLTVTSVILGESGEIIDLLTSDEIEAMETNILEQIYGAG